VSEERKERIPGEKNSAPGEGKGRDVSRKAAWGIALLLALLWAGTMAFYNVPAFHQLLHPHPAGGTGGTAEESGKYTCPMHPFIVTDRPGACPICGMTLVPQESMAPPGGAGDNEAGTIGRVSMSPTQRLMANVATQVVARREFVLDTFSVGKVSWDERRVAKVTARFGGRVEKLHVDFTGTGVTRGQPLLDIYSPELIATQREVLLAIEGMERMKESPYPDARDMSAGLLDASRRRLALWGVTGAQIEGLEKTKEPKTVFTVSAPTSGIVTERLVAAGQYVMEGTPLYSIAEIDPVWVQAEIYETEIHKVPVGTPAVVTTEAYPGREFKALVAFVDPFLDPGTRTVKVRIDLPNPGRLLKPDMFVNVLFQGRKGKELAVPDSAVLITGERAMAWVEVKPNTFEPRVVKVGHKSNGFFEILSGLSEGETVVTSGGFLIDSESQLRSGLPDPHAGHGGK
jgi:membrane fusion protein, copper/silver efflux system